LGKFGFPETFGLFARDRAFKMGLSLINFSILFSMGGGEEFSNFGYISRGKGGNFFIITRGG